MSNWILVSIFSRICFCAVIVSEASRWQFAMHFLLEMCLLTIFFRVMSKWLRLIALPFLVLHILQFVNIINTGYWVDTNTLQNLTEVAAVGNKTLLLSISCFIAYALLWLPDLIIKPFATKRGHI